MPARSSPPRPGPRLKRKPPLRTPNVQRSAATRAKLLDAAVMSLYEIGYHQTSTVVVAERAGVSRGAMLHQFPTKADLMMGVAEHIVLKRGELHRERLSSLPSARDKFLGLVDVLWEAMLSPTGVARIELMLSSRSDPQLAHRFQAQNDALDRKHKDLVWGLAEQAGVDGRHKAAVEDFVQLYAASLRGLAIDALRKESRKGAHAAVALLKRFQADLFEGLLADARPRKR